MVDACCQLPIPPRHQCELRPSSGEKPHKYVAVLEECSEEKFSMNHVPGLFLEYEDGLLLE
jgi:hypothetical protein